MSARHIWPTGGPRKAAGRLSLRPLLHDRITDKPRFHTLEKPVTKRLASLARASKKVPTCLVPRCVPLVGGCGFRSEGRF